MITNCFVLQPTFIKNTTVKITKNLENIEEALSLVEAVGGIVVVGSHTINVRKIISSTFFSKNFLGYMNDLTKSLSVELLFININISPIQQRNIEKALKLKVIDRTGLILEIFAARANSFEGKLQVDLARNSYQKSRLVRSWTHLERQRGGRGFLGGPGETQIEADRRQLNDRIKNIKAKIKVFEKTQDLQRSSRAALQLPFVTLVGYTNVGKTSLFNRLTKSSKLEKDMLFATLDSTARRVVMPSSKSVILSDTIGFISNLPTSLIQSFKATLKEVTFSNLILHIVDLSNPFAKQQKDEVEKILNDLNIDFERTKIIGIGNKADIICDANDHIAVKGLSLKISAKADENFDELIRLIDLHISESLQKESLTLSFTEGRKRSWLLENNLIQEEKILQSGIKVKVRWSERQKGIFYNL